MKIYLIGFMACGKTTVGAELALALGYGFVDLDRYIEAKHRKTIAQIFEADGEERFRAAEQDALGEVALLNGNFVVASGGGTPCFHGGIDAMNGTGITVYLRVEASALASRLMSGNARRPLLWQKSVEELTRYVAKTLRERERFYAQAQVVVDATCLDPHSLAQSIKKIVEQGV